jgi:hypothetical protein
MRGEARGRSTAQRDMSDVVVVRRRVVFGERAFSVLGDTAFDRRTGEWSARLLFVPLDRSLPRTVASKPIKRGTRRDDVVRSLSDVSDADLARASRTVVPASSRRSRSR